MNAALTIAVDDVKQGQGGAKNAFGCRHVTEALTNAAH